LPELKELSKKIELIDYEKHILAKKSLFQLLKTLTVLPNSPIIYHQVIAKLVMTDIGGNKANMLYKTLFKWQEERHAELIDLSIHNHMIVFAGHNNDLDLAEEAYLNAKDYIKRNPNETHDVIKTYTMMIDALKNIDNLNRAYEVFLDAKESGHVDVFIL